MFGVGVFEIVVVDDVFVVGVVALVGVVLVFIEDVVADAFVGFWLW